MRLEVAQIWSNNAAQLSKPCTKSKHFYVNNAAIATEMLGQLKALAMQPLEKATAVRLQVHMRSEEEMPGRLKALAMVPS